MEDSFWNSRCSADVLDERPCSKALYVFFRKLALVLHTLKHEYVSYFMYQPFKNRIGLSNKRELTSTVLIKQT